MLYTLARHCLLLPTSHMPLVDAEAAAVLLGISRKTLDELVKLGLPRYNVALSTKTRRSLRFDVEEAKAWLATRNGSTESKMERPNGREPGQPEGSKDGQEPMS